MNAKSRKFYEIAKTLAEQNGSQIIFEFDPGARASTEISMTLSDNKFDLMQNLKIKNPKNFSVLVAEPNPNAFFVLRKNLEFIGIDVKPSSEWSIVKRHIEDMIFRPGAVFIEENLLSEIDDALTALLIEKDRASRAKKYKCGDKFKPENPHLDAATAIFTGLPCAHFK